MVYSQGDYGIEFFRILKGTVRLSYIDEGREVVSPFRDHPGHDQVLQCFAGIAAQQGGAEGPKMLRGSIVDFYTSPLRAFGVTAARAHRYRAGEGQRVDLSLLRSFIALQPGRFVWAEGEPRGTEREPAAGRLTAAHPTKDGLLYVQATTPHLWRSLCAALELDDLATDPRYDTVRKRFERSDEVMPRIGQALLGRTAAEWEAPMLGKVPAVVVRDIDDMLDHPQALAEDRVVEHEHPTLGRYRPMTQAVTFSGESRTTRAPVLAEHSDDVMRSFGFGTEEIGPHRANGAVA